MLNQSRPLIITLMMGITILFSTGCRNLETSSNGVSSPKVSPISPTPKESAIQSAPASLPQSIPSGTISPTPLPKQGVTPSPSLPSNVPQVITPPTSDCKIIMAQVQDTTPLNVRSQPEKKEGNIVGKLENNTWVTIAEDKNGWFRITEPMEGWIYKDKTKSSCSTIKKGIDLTKNNPVIVKGEMVGTGTHAYVIKARQGQTLTIQKNQGVFPMILSPNGKILAGDPYQDSQRTQWSAKLNVSGDYVLQFDSNYKGFTYDFSVSLVND